LSRGARLNVWQAAKMGRLDDLKTLIDADPKLLNAANGWGTALHEAAYHGQLAVVEYLLSRGADASRLSSDERTPLKIAIQRGHPEVADLLRGHEP
jgi:ankyrin repeat protein